MTRRQRRREARERKKLEEKLKKEGGHWSHSIHLQPIPERPTGIRPRLIWLFRNALAFVLGGTTLLSLQQFIITVPDIRPVDFGSSSPYPVMFMIHNPLILTMYEAQIASMLGPILEGGKPDLQDLRVPLRRVPGSPDPCQRMLKYPDLVAAAGKFDAFGEVNYEMIKPGKDVIFDEGSTVSGNVRAVIAVAVLYRVKPMGIATLWKRTTCSVFQTATDSEGHFHVFPYAEEHSH
jgi:hypothetical protein